MISLPKTYLKHLVVLDGFIRFDAENKPAF